MTQSYCASCYRSLSPGETCPSCYPARAPRRVSRVALLIGVAGLAVLIVGVLSLNPRLCFVGAIVAGAAALLQAVRRS